MFLLLEIVLIMYVFIAYELNKSILSVSVVCGCMFLLSTIVAMIHFLEWDINMSLNTCAVIIFSLILLLIGERVGTVVAFRTKNKTTEKKVPKSRIFINRILMFFSVLFMVFTFIIYYKESIQLANNIGYSNGLIFAYIRLAKSLGEGLPSYVGYMYMAATCMAYMYTYIVLHNIIRIKCNLMSHKLELINIGIYLGLTILTTGRTELMYYIIYTLALYLMINAGISAKVRLSIKNICKAVAVVVMFFCAFYLLGFLTGKGQISTFEEMISLYVGGSIAALNEYIQNPVYNTTGTFGAHTLFGVFTLLNNFGFDIEILSRPLEFVEIGTMTTNIYTALRRYIQDFGYWGLSFIMLFIGIVFGKVHKAAITKSDFFVIVYAMSIFVAVEMAIEERFFMTFLTTGFLYKVCIIAILYHFIVARRCR